MTSRGRSRPAPPMVAARRRRPAGGEHQQDLLGRVGHRGDRVSEHRQRDPSWAAACPPAGRCAAGDRRTAVSRPRTRHQCDAGTGASGGRKSFRALRKRQDSDDVQLRLHAGVLVPRPSSRAGITGDLVHLDQQFPTPGPGSGPVDRTAGRHPAPARPAERSRVSLAKPGGGGCRGEPAERSRSSTRYSAGPSSEQGPRCTARERQRGPAHCRPCRRAPRRRPPPAAPSRSCECRRCCPPAAPAGRHRRAG